MTTISPEDLANLQEMAENVTPGRNEMRTLYANLDQLWVGFDDRQRTIAWTQAHLALLMAGVSMTSAAVDGFARGMAAAVVVMEPKFAPLAAATIAACRAFARGEQMPRRAVEDPQ